MTKLTDTQTILLSTASQRGCGSLLPLPATLTDATSVTRAITALIKRGLAEERATNDPASVNRSDGDVRYGVFITVTGLEAIGVEQETGGSEPAPEPAAVAEPERASKTAAVIALLQRDEGATTAELIGATNWLPHTTRAALTGLRKKGHVIERSKRGTETCYHIVTAV